jgi:hypothetical protein
MLLFWQSGIRGDLTQKGARLILAWPMNSKSPYLFRGCPLVATIKGLGGRAKVTVVSVDNHREFSLTSTSGLRGN